MKWLSWVAVAASVIGAIAAGADHNWLAAVWASATALWALGDAIRRQVS